MIGTRLGPYEITAKLGEGGMGEVYRALDTKLKRDVAIKVLPPAFTEDKERLARFEREAQLLAQLHHPNIASIFGLEESDGTRALVMELVEGPTLAERLEPGALPFNESLSVSLQIAHALEEAHEKGIVHRDLKPQNVKASIEGKVKVLDFGLAKAMDPAAGSAASAADLARSPTLMQSPTLTAAHGTQLGVILGTAAYMAPEQAKGLAVDKRADIWAFGVVLYEMLVGRSLFAGDTVTDTLAGVLKTEIDFAKLPESTPPAIRRLLRRCLERNPKNRLHDIADARLELEETLGSSPPVDEPAGVTADAASVSVSLRRSARRAWIAVAGVAAVAAFLAIAMVGSRDDGALAAERMQFTVAEGGGVVGWHAPSLSPDGRLLAFIGRSTTGVPQILVRPLDGLEARALAGTEGAGSLFWIDGSRAIGYAVGNRVYRIGADGGRPQPLSEVSAFAGGAWLPSGDILLASFAGSDGRLLRATDQGGAPVEVARQHGGESATAFVWPAALPGGRRFLYLGWSMDLSERALYAGSLDGAPPVRLIASDSIGAYAAPGYILFVRGASLFAQPFDAASLDVSGTPTRLADDVAIDVISGRALFTVSQTGVLAYQTAGGVTGMSDLEWLDRTGKTVSTVGNARNHLQIRLSPDGNRVAVAETGSGQLIAGLSVLDLGNGVASALTGSKVGSAVDPVWSSDGETVAFSAMQENGRQLFTQRVGSSTPTLAFESADSPKWLDDWSPDGKFMLFHLSAPGKLFAVSLDEPRTARLLIEATESIDGAHFSPDGNWIAYQVIESGVYQVWVASFPAFDRRRRISPQGGGQAFWRGDGREIFYLTPTGGMMAVAVTPSPSGALDFSAPVELFQSPLTKPGLEIDQYSVTRDGERFLFIRPHEMDVARPPLTVVVNWPVGLHRPE